MAARWLRNKRTGGLRADLGHGLELKVWREGVEPIRPGSPSFNVSVFGIRLETRARDEREGRQRAEAVAKSWLFEARTRM